MSVDAPAFVVRRAISGAQRPGHASPCVRLMLELTERCDNACIHCYINRPADDADARARELSTAEVKRILDEAAALGTWVVRFTGGEPLLRDDFDEIYLHARRQGLRVQISSNARRITPERAELFARIPPLEPIDVTVYGMRRETYEGISRAPGSYEEFRQGVALLLDRKVRFGVRAVLLPSFEAERGEFEAWASTIPWMKEAPFYTTELDLRARRDDEEAMDRIRRLRKPPEQWSHPVEEEATYRSRMALFSRSQLGPPGERLFSCAAGLKCSVDAYGVLQPCLQLRHPATVYDLRNGSLREGVGEIRSRLVAMKAADPAYLERCAKCFLRNLCQQCPAKSWMEHGTLETPVDYLCAVTHSQAVKLGWLYAGEKAWEVVEWRERARSIGPSTLPAQSNGREAPGSLKGEADG